MALSREVDIIHAANELYWRRGEAMSIGERAEYHKRLERLERLRIELEQLRSK
jgi:hypothetical protein